MTSVPPDARPTGGNKTSGAADAWYSNATPKDEKLPPPALISSATKPAACGGLLHVAADAVSASDPATIAGTTLEPNLHANG